MTDGLKIAALVPVYNEVETLGPLLERLLPWVERVQVVDDGSNDGSAEVAAAWQFRQPEKIRLHTRPNGGKGRALRAGFARLLRENYTHIVTLDADLQHRPEDLPHFRAEAVRTGAELVIGTRLHQKEGYPKARYRANAVGDWWISRILKHAVEDAQSGYRLYETKLLRQLELHESGFAIETELLVRMIRLGGRTAFVPIPPIYEGVGSHFRPIFDTYKICLAFANAMEQLHEQRGRP